MILCQSSVKTYNLLYYFGKSNEPRRNGSSHCSERVTAAASVAFGGILQLEHFVGAGVCP